MARSTHGIQDTGRLVQHRKDRCHINWRDTSLNWSLQYFSCTYADADLSYTSLAAVEVQVYSQSTREPWQSTGKLFICLIVNTNKYNQVLKVNQDRFVNHLETELKIKDPKDWYQVPQRQLQEAGGATIIKKMGGMNRVEREKGGIR